MRPETLVSHIDNAKRFVSEYMKIFSDFLNNFEIFDYNFVFSRPTIHTPFVQSVRKIFQSNIRNF